MTLDFLPPQAYTKETLLKAYNWLQSQSDQVKELATTPDQLVSLFLKSTRLGDSLQRYTTPTPSAPTPTHNGSTFSDSADRPSLQNFKSELKNLAGMMGDLEKPPAPANSPQYSYQAPPTQPPAPSYQSAPQHVYQGPSASVTTSQSTVSNPGYDEMTQNLIREVKNELNLSSDTEALRMLVKIGYQKVRSLYK